MKQKRKERIDRGIKARSDDVFSLNSFREMLYVAVPPLAPVLLLIILPLVLPSYWQKVLISTCVFALLAMSWDFLVGVGMVSLGQALFFGVGAYIAGVSNKILGLTYLDRSPNCYGSGRTYLHGPVNAGPEVARRLLFHGDPRFAVDAGTYH